MDVTAVLFPGQGSQEPGMREEAAALRPDLLELVCEVVGEDPFVRVEESTAFAQPAILCASLARWSALDTDPSYLLGHSLGEIGALAAAGALTDRQALALVAARGRLMAAAGRPNDGMLAVLRGEPAAVAALAKRHRVTVANDNAPGQMVLSGDLDLLDAASRDARGAGLRTLRLPVTGAFHSPAMAPAREPWERVLAETEFAPLRVPVVSCLTAAPIEDPRAALAASLTAPVRFREALLYLADQGCDEFIEVGPGRVLEGLVKRTLPAHV